MKCQSGNASTPGPKPDQVELCVLGKNEISSLNAVEYGALHYSVADGVL